ncbi:MAG: hypothetical protein ABEI97_03100, partial [Candidatus Nanohaloarchaea archaeon]
MRRLLLLMMVLGLLTSGAAAAPLQNFQFNPSNGFVLDVTGGETFTMETTFENTAGKDLPLVVKLTASSDRGMTGGEFTLDAVSNSYNRTWRNTTLTCSYKENIDANTSVYTCLNSSVREILPRSTGPGSGPSTTNVTVDVTAATNIVPGNYSLAMDVMSKVGVPAAPEQVETVNASTTPTVSSGNVAVEVDTNGTANVTVQEYNRVSVSAPASQNFVSGVDVAVDPATNTSVNASGIIKISY